MPFINSVTSKVFRKRRTRISGPLDGTRGTVSNPGVSAQEIYDAGNTSSGWYYIQTSGMETARQVYCNMDDESGGWMLVSYNPSNVTGSPGSVYPNVWNNGQGTLNKLSTNVMDLWYHNGTAQCNRVMKMASTSADRTPALDNMGIANYVLYDNPENLNLSSVNPTVITNNIPMTGTWFAIKGHTLMTGPLSVNAPGDWIYQAGNWWTVCGPSSQLSTDGRSGNAQGTGSWTNSLQSILYGMADVTETTTSSRSDIETYAIFVK